MGLLSHPGAAAMTVVARVPPDADEALVARCRAGDGGAFETLFERGLATLSPMQRIVLVMKGIEGLSCQQIAAALRCSVGTVMSRLHYARVKMQRHLARRHALRPGRYGRAAVLSSRAAAVGPPAL